MAVEIKGERALLIELEKRLGIKRVEVISDKALKKAAEAFKTELISQFETFKDTGASIEEITLSEPEWIDGARTITVHWRGPKDRYRLIHLNEFGTVKNPNPRGKGAIARALRNSEKVYREIIKRELGAL